METTPKKRRLDHLLVTRGLAESREKAQRLIRAGQVRVNGQVHSKPGHEYPEDADIILEQAERYVGRGGEKLEAAFQTFAIMVEGLVCADIGASTGGFTDCLLQHGAVRVYAVDVGKGQLHWKLRQDARVVVMDTVNARHLQPGDLPEPLDFATIDASFISLTKILPAVTALLKDGGRMVTLIKPQFEAGRKFVEKGGVVKDPAVHENVIAAVRRFAETEVGLESLGICPSPVKGPAGNVEFLAYWKKP